MINSDYLSNYDLASRVISIYYIKTKLMASQAGKFARFGSIPARQGLRQARAAVWHRIAAHSTSMSGLFAKRHCASFVYPATDIQEATDAGRRHNLAQIKLGRSFFLIDQL